MRHQAPDLDKPSGGVAASLALPWSAPVRPIRVLIRVEDPRNLLRSIGHLSLDQDWLRVPRSVRCRLALRRAVDGITALAGAEGFAAVSTPWDDHGMKGTAPSG
jgi:hypothetical protein